MFSVVIPAYNSEGTIYNALKSVSDQTRVDLVEEIIVIDDGSVDHTKFEIERFSIDYPNIKLCYTQESNHGASFARNLGIKKAKAEWIALLDSDDMWHCNKLEVQYNVLQEMPEICFLGSSPRAAGVLVDKNIRVYKLNARQLCIRSTPTTPTVIFKKDIGIELGLFDENMKYCEDINFFQKFLLLDNYYIYMGNLVTIGQGKKYFSESGASSDLLSMAKGRDRNVKELYRMNMISRSFMSFILAFNKMKLLRRLFLTKLNRMVG